MKTWPITLSFASMLLVGACKKQAGSSATTADSTFQIKLKIGDGAEATFSAQRLTIYQAKPPKAGQPERPQGFELRGDGFVLAGSLPAELKLAPQQNYELLVGQPLQVQPRGGDPSLLAMSKITTSDGRVYVAKSGTVTVDESDASINVSGKIDCELQEIKLGDTDDPNNKGDQPVGNSVTATGTFSAKAASVPYEQL
jgi:hypothetical protein